MANEFGIHSIGNSIVTFLRNSFEQSELRDDFPDCTFRLISSGELGGTDDITSVLSLYLYRISINEHLRNVQHERRPNHFEVPLALDLHYLLTAWFSSAVAEHTVMAWAMQQIYAHPMLGVASLSPEGGWREGDVVQVIPAELSNEDVMRIWDALKPSYRLSFSYTARVIRVESASQSDVASTPVVASRFHVDEVEGVR